MYIVLNYAETQTNADVRSHTVPPNISGLQRFAFE